MTISKEQMIEDINGYFCGMLESITCSGEKHFDSSKNYVLFKDWKTAQGNIIELVVPGVTWNEGYNLYGREATKLPTYLQQAIDAEVPGSETLIDRLWMRIKGYDY